MTDDVCDREGQGRDADKCTMRPAVLLNGAPVGNRLWQIEWSRDITSRHVSIVRRCVAKVVQ